MNKPVSHYATPNQVGYLVFLEGWLGHRKTAIRGEVIARSFVVGRLVQLTREADRRMKAGTAPACPTCKGSHESLKEMKACYTEKRYKNNEQKTSDPEGVPG